MRTEIISKVMQQSRHLILIELWKVELIFLLSGWKVKQLKLAKLRCETEGTLKLLNEIYGSRQSGKTNAIQFFVDGGV